MSRVAEVLRRDRLYLGILALAFAAYAALSLWLTRGTTLFVDEVQIFLGDHGFHPESLLAPLNGHLIATARVFHEGTYELFGADFLVLRVVMVVGALLAALAFFALLKERIGVPAAIAPTVLVLFLGTAWETTLIVSGITNTYSIAAGLGALLALERGSTRGDMVACALLVVSVASWSLGVAFAIGIGVLVILQPNRQRRLFVFLVPIGLYLAWLVWAGTVEAFERQSSPALELENLAATPNFVVDQVAATAGAITGLNYDFGSTDQSRVFRTESVFGPLLAALVVAALVLRFRRGKVPAMAWALAVTLVVFCGALAVNEGRSPDTARYVYPTAVIALLICAEAARGVRISNRTAAVIFAVAAVGVAANVLRMADGTAFFRGYSWSLRAELSAVELARDYVDPAFLALPEGIGPVQAGPYLAAVDRIGSPAFSPSELAHQDEDVRARADAALVRAGSIAIGEPLQGEGERNCRRRPGGSLLEVSSPGAVVDAQTTSEVLVRRFADATAAPLEPLPGGQPGAIRVQRDRSNRPWLVEIEPAAGGVRICDLDPQAG